MNEMTEEFIPVIVGTDINAYYMSASFHEEYGIKPYVIGKVQMGFTHYSSIIANVKIADKLDDSEQFVKAVMAYAEQIESKGKKLVLIGTNDHYVRLIVENREILAERFIFNYLDEPLMNILQDKKAFYQLAEKEGLPIPDTFFHEVGQVVDIPIKRYPVILKPSNGIEYYNHKFPGQEKVYRLNTIDEVQAVIKKIEDSGYQGDVIIQDYIPGDDTLIWDSVLYVNSKGKAELVTFGQVALQEHEATAIGNYTAIVSRYDEEMMDKLKHFLESINYRGFANVDLKYDERDEQFKLFEVNVRQGRSSYYATQMGHNLARYLIDDIIYNRTKDCTFAYKEVLFSIVPKYILKEYVKNEEMNSEVRRLIKDNKWGNPLFYKKDRSLLRKFYLLVRQMRYGKKYKNARWYQ